MSQPFLKIMLGSNSNADHRVVPVPEGVEVLFTNEPPTAQFIDSNDKVIRTFNLTHSAYLINGEGKTISSFSNSGWNVRTHESKVTNTSYDDWSKEIHQLSLKYNSKFILTDVTEAVNASHYDRTNKWFRGKVAGKEVEIFETPISNDHIGEGSHHLRNFVLKRERAIHFVPADNPDHPGYICCLIKFGNNKHDVRFIALNWPIDKPLHTKQSLFEERLNVLQALPELTEWSITDATDLMGETVYDATTYRLRGDVSATMIDTLYPITRGNPWIEIQNLVNTFGKPIKFTNPQFRSEYLCCLVNNRENKKSIEFFALDLPESETETSDNSVKYIRKLTDEEISIYCSPLYGLVDAENLKVLYGTEGFDITYRARDLFSDKDLPAVIQYRGNDYVFIKHNFHYNVGILINRNDSGNDDRNYTVYQNWRIDNITEEISQCAVDRKQIVGKYNASVADFGDIMMVGDVTRYLDNQKADLAYLISGKRTCDKEYIYLKVDGRHQLYVIDRAEEETTDRDGIIDVSNLFTDVIYNEGWALKPNSVIFAKYINHPDLHLVTMINDYRGKYGCGYKELMVRKDGDCYVSVCLEGKYYMYKLVTSITNEQAKGAN